MFCLFISSFKNMFKRYVQWKSLFFNRSYVVEHRKDVIKTVYVHPLGTSPPFYSEWTLVGTFWMYPKTVSIFRRIIFLLLFENILKLIQVSIHEWADLYFFFYKNLFANSIYFWRPGVFRKKRKETHRFICLPISLYFSCM